MPIADIGRLMAEGGGGADDGGGLMAEGRRAPEDGSVERGAWSGGRRKMEIGDRR